MNSQHQIPLNKPIIYSVFNYRNNVFDNFRSKFTDLKKSN